MSKHTIVILQDNVRKAESLAEEFEKSGDFTVVGLSSDGEEGAGLILSTQCEYCVTDLILQSLDGLGVLDRVRKAGAKTRMIVYSSLSGDEVVETSIQKGAAYYVTKPCPEETLVKRVRDLFLTDKSDDVREVAANKSPALDEKISKIFISVGIPPHIKGYSYLREGIKLAVCDPDVINNITKKLYPMIGEKYSTTPSKVERAIRHAIEVAWARGRINNINDLFGVQTYLAGEKPTNGEFIALIADKMLLEGA
ncbi:MAG: sporulation transcription factor Spo0A [Clostridia bacterium]|nr:sporulation transcription factor Spo0A [Clostridia bacterium]MDY2714992.1 sporulation transcription factor Spo0A [Christensenellaceae bacterium]MDY3724178.1 sporulation transcription factor Spo0A [Christensenellaceae bacterium]